MPCTFVDPDPVPVPLPVPVPDPVPDPSEVPLGFVDTVVVDPVVDPLELDCEGVRLRPNPQLIVNTRAPHRVAVLRQTFARCAIMAPFVSQQ